MKIPCNHHRGGEGWGWHAGSIKYLQSRFLQKISAVNASTAVLTSHVAGPGRAYTPKYWVVWHGEVWEGI